MSQSPINFKPSDVIALAVQGDDSCLMVTHDGSGARPSFDEALVAAADQAATTNRGVLITHQSIPALRRLLMKLNGAAVPDFLRK